MIILLSLVYYSTTTQNTFIQFIKRFNIFIWLIMTSQHWSFVILIFLIFWFFLVVCSSLYFFRLIIRWFTIRRFFSFSNMKRRIRIGDKGFLLFFRFNVWRDLYQTFIILIRNLFYRLLIRILIFFQGILTNQRVLFHN